MAYDDLLAARVRELLSGEDGLTERRMFGGIGFMVDGNMAVAASSSTGDLMVRADPTTSLDWLDGVSVRPMEMRGREMSGWLLVTGDALVPDGALRLWVDRGLARARSFPPK